MRNLGIRGKIRSSGKNNIGSPGITRLGVILLVIIGILLILLLIPVFKYYSGEAGASGCESAMSTARHELAIEYNFTGTKTPEEIKKIVGRAMAGWDNICPSGGNIYVVVDEKSDIGYTLVCGIHDSNLKERTRLNAGYALDKLNEILIHGQFNNDDYHDGVDIEMNGTTIHAVPVTKELEIKMGTKAYPEYSGTVIYYMPKVFNKDLDLSKRVGQGTLVSYFVYADEDYAAIWKEKEQWTGDSYEGS